jgi:hypothetical protein
LPLLNDREFLPTSFAQSDRVLSHLEGLWLRLVGGVVVAMLVAGVHNSWALYKRPALHVIGDIIRRWWFQGIGVAFTTDTLPNHWRVDFGCLHKRVCGVDRQVWSICLHKRDDVRRGGLHLRSEKKVGEALRFCAFVPCGVRGGPEP